MDIDDLSFEAALISACDRASQPAIPGLVLKTNLISEEEEKDLLVQIDRKPWDGSIGRRTQHYGFRYNYSNKSATERAPNIPPWAVELGERLVAQGLLLVQPDQLIINEYKPGQGITAHVDHIKYFADGIASISLGSQVVMEFAPAQTSRGKPHEVILPSRSVVVLHGDARYQWSHCIPARKEDHGVARGRRVSLTFRKMK